MTWICDQGCFSENDDDATECSNGHPRPARFGYGTPAPRVPVYAPEPGSGERLVLCPNCEAEMAFDTQNCLRCGHALNPPTPAGGAATLVLPNGVSVVLPIGETVSLGRHSADPVIAAAYASFDQVSRHQAELTIDGKTATVRHVGHTNPTYVNDVGVVHEKTVSLIADVRIRFGRESETEAVVRPSEAR